MHKLRNILAYLPEPHHAQLKLRFKRMMGCNRYSEAKSELEHIKHWLQETNTTAYNSLVEAGDEIITVHRLGLTPRLRRSLQSTNLIESLLSVVREKSRRVKNWDSSPTQRLRWVASAINYHKKKMRRIDGCKEISVLINALNKNTLDQQQRMA